MISCDLDGAEDGLRYRQSDDRHWVAVAFAVAFEAWEGDFAAADTLTQSPLLPSAFLHSPSGSDSTFEFVPPRQVSLSSQIPSFPSRVSRACGDVGLPLPLSIDADCPSECRRTSSRVATSFQTLALVCESPRCQRLRLDFQPMARARLPTFLTGQDFVRHQSSFAVLRVAAAGGQEPVVQDWEQFAGSGTRTAFEQGAAAPALAVPSLAAAICAVRLHLDLRPNFEMGRVIVRRESSSAALHAAAVEQKPVVED